MPWICPAVSIFFPCATTKNAQYAAARLFRYVVTGCIADRVHELLFGDGPRIANVEDFAHRDVVFDRLPDGFAQIADEGVVHEFVVIAKVRKLLGP